MDSLKLFVLLGLIGLVLGGCGDDDGPAGPAPSSLLVESQFDEGLDGWEAGTHTSLFGSVVWLDRRGGVVKLDGVGFDGTPNAWIARQIELPSDARTIRTSTSAHDRGQGAVSLRVRVEDDSSNSHLLQDWQTLDTGDEGFEFIDQAFDVSAYAGQTVTVYFEIGDDDGGGNNQRYIDYVEIHR